MTPGVLSAPRAASVDSPPSRVTAWAGTNIALVKYWGKRPGALNLPAAGSLSLTLAELGTTTSVRFLPATSGQDVVVLNGEPAKPVVAARTSRFLDLVRNRANLTAPAEVITRNTVPTAAGLASSASGFAALALAASRAAGLNLDPPALSRLARQGSGSAARSIFGGFVQMDAGLREDGEDAFAWPLLPPDAWEVRLVVALTARGEKALGSTEAMQHTGSTSPFHEAWIASVPADLRAAHTALERRDLDALGRIAERSCLRMHAAAMAADPGILYWNPVTLGAIEAVKLLRQRGTAAFFTIDAGPHVKVLCRSEDAAQVQAALAEVPGVLETLVARPGEAARVLPAVPEVA
ncbi:MAG: diphosphomevalonate decarboxylase [Myxococcales bacterium]|nr:diphosphomevalonate decarboxylase [Myxococcales bacterium]